MNASTPNDPSPGAFISGDFVVLINHEEQYAIWPANKPLPEKWRSVGITGPKQHCLEYIRQVWTDMRPLSVRISDQARARASTDTSVCRSHAGPPADVPKR